MRPYLVVIFHLRQQYMTEVSVQGCDVAVADVRFEAHYGLKSDIAPGPKSANAGRRLGRGPKPGAMRRNAARWRVVLILVVQPAGTLREISFGLPASVDHTSHLCH